MLFDWHKISLINSDFVDYEFICTVIVGHLLIAPYQVIASIKVKIYAVLDYIIRQYLVRRENECHRLYLLALFFACYVTLFNAFDKFGMNFLNLVKTYFHYDFNEFFSDKSEICPYGIGGKLSA